MKKIALQKILGLLMLLHFPLMFYGQQAPEKFGKISAKDLEATVCPMDSNAQAYFIFDYGYSYFQYNAEKGFEMRFNRHFRIKILDSKAFSWANVEVPLYRDSEEEQLTQVKAVTYTLEDGKVVKTKLKRKDILTEETSEHWITKKFAMPNVRQGAVLEVEYTVGSTFFFNLNRWAFQHDIPVMYSEYLVEIPEYFKFNQTQKGYFPVATSRDSRNTRITEQYVKQTGGTTRKVQSDFMCRLDITNFKATQVPSFPAEGYLRTKKNYTSAIEFELESIKFPNTQIRYYTTDWTEINKKLMTSDYFGKALNHTGHLKDQVKALKASGASGIELIDLAFRTIKNRMAWNGGNSKYVTTSLRKAYNEGSGNVADINLNLVGLLRDMGFFASPVVLSTQSNGIIHPAHPSISRFNYVIALVKVEGTDMLMDATDPNSEINLLPVRCLNDKGMVVNTGAGEWINLMDYKPYNFMESYTLGFTDELAIKGVNEMKLADYAAYKFKARVKKYNNMEEYKKSMEETNNDFKITKLDVPKLDSVQGAFVVSMDFTQGKCVEQTGDLAFFKPFQPFVSENPFKLEKREYPVEFDYPMNVQQVYYITLPNGYEISELPKPLVARSPDGKLRYMYNVLPSTGGLTISIMFSVGKTLFLPEEYQPLKDFYQMVVDKQDEMIVMKKKG